MGPGTDMTKVASRWFWLIILIAGAGVTIIACTMIGPTGFGIPPGGMDPAGIISGIRLPRVLTAFCVGGSLAIAGAAMQALFRNPMADPYILGTSSGGALGAAIAVVFFGGLGMPLFAWAGAVLAILIVWSIAGRQGVIPVETLLLTASQYRSSSLPLSRS